MIHIDWRLSTGAAHDDVIKWKYYRRCWPFVRGIRWPVNSPHKGQWRGTLIFSLICTRINAWLNNRKAGYLRRHHAHYDVIVLWCDVSGLQWCQWVIDGMWVSTAYLIVHTPCTHCPWVPGLFEGITIYFIHDYDSTENNTLIYDHVVTNHASPSL